MSHAQDLIGSAFENRAILDPTAHEPELRSVVLKTLRDLDAGQIRVSERINGEWVVHEWIKKAILLYFRLHANTLLDPHPGQPHLGPWYDKIPLKFQNWDEKKMAALNIRVVPPAVVRFGAYVAPGAILMPSYVNIGAYVGENSMIDTWATVGSCAQIGQRVHISGGAGIGGVLEPLQARPTIIEDDCFIGARSEVAEGVIVGQGAVLSMGVFIGQSTRVYNRLTGEMHRGYVPPYSVVVPGTLPAADGSHGLYAAIIVKTVDAQTRAKVSLNELLRDPTHEYAGPG